MQCVMGFKIAASFLGLLVLLFSEARCQIVEDKKLETAVPEESIKTVLVRFCATCSFPNSGIFIETFSEIPEPSSIPLLLFAVFNKEASQELNLTDHQLDSISKLKLQRIGGYDLKEYEKAILFLNEGQKRKLELAGLLLDGGVALRSRYFIKKLSLEKDCIKAIVSDINALRQNVALPHLGITFSGGRSEQKNLIIWKRVTDSVLLNHRIVDQLNERQQNALASVFVEAERDSQILVSLYLQNIQEPFPEDKGG